MEGSLVAVGVVNLAIAALFVVVGLRLALRPVERQYKAALLAMAIWWLSMAILETIQGVETLVAATRGLPVAVFQADRYVNGALVGGGCWALAFHVAYLWSGNLRWLMWLAPVYVLVTALHWSTTALAPVSGYELQAFQVELHYRRPLLSTPTGPWTVLGVGGTMVVAPLSYLRLARSLSPDQRRRAILVSSGILLWGGVPFIAYLTRSPLADFLTITAMTAVAAILANIGYFPARRKVSPFVEIYSPPPLPEDEKLWQR